MKKRMLTIVIAICLALPLTVLAVAGTNILAGKQNGVSFMTGGVGKTERSQMESQAQDYNLKIVVSKDSGAYLARLPLTIYDSDNAKVIDMTMNGPWFYANLPEGRYTVRVNHDEGEKKKTVKVDQGLELVMFSWNN